MKPEEWEELAANRIKKILDVRRICSQSQLEAKISEAGPPKLRPNPGILKKARRTLKTRGDIREIKFNNMNTPFHTLSSSDPRQDKRRYNYIKQTYKTFLKYTNTPKLCGKVAEGVVHKAILDSGSMNVYGSVENQLKVLNGVRILKGPLDFLIRCKKTGIELGVEVKNKRRWYHQEDWEMWESIAKCVSIKVLPVFVCRKFNYLLYPRVFSIIGCFGFQLHNQFFHPSLENKMRDVQHKDGLGFADIRFPQQVKNGFMPKPWHVKYFRDTIPQNIESFYSRYKSCLPVLHKYLVEERFWEEPIDRELFKEFYDELFDGPQDEEQPYNDWVEHL